MEHNLHQTIALLSRTPDALDALLRDLPEFWTSHNEGGNTWTPIAIVEHLVYLERTNWLARVKFILEVGDAQVFPPLNREGGAGADRTLNESLEEFAVLRRANIDELRALGLQPADFERRGKHPAFGIVTLSELLATWAAHDLNHLHQLSRVMAHQYKHSVGPWKAYLGVLKCDGHSAPA